MQVQHPKLTHALLFFRDAALQQLSITRFQESPLEGPDAVASSTGTSSSSINNTSSSAWQQHGVSSRRQDAVVGQRFSKKTVEDELRQVCAYVPCSTACFGCGALHTAVRGRCLLADMAVAMQRNHLVTCVCRHMLQTDKQQMPGLTSRMVVDPFPCHT